MTNDPGVTQPTKREVLRDLETRLDSAIRSLDLLASERTGSHHVRLLGKRQGLQLALSYLQEIER